MCLRTYCLAAILLLLLLLSTQPIAAQSNWWYPERGSAITVELLRPHYDVPNWHEENRGPLNMIGFIGGRHHVSEEMVLFWDLPFANLDVDEETSPYDYYEYYYWYSHEEDELIIGNPLIGIEQSIVGPSFFVRGSFRLPIVSDEKWNASKLGVITAYDRFEAFVSKLFTIKLDVGYRESNDDTPLEAQVMLGTVSMVSSEGEGELFADYSGYLGFSAGKFAGGGFVGGRFLISQEGIDFGDRFVNFGGATLRFKLGVIEPGLLVRINLDNELSKTVDYSYGLNIAFPLGRRFNNDNDSEWK